MRGRTRRARPRDRPAAGGRAALHEGEVLAGDLAGAQRGLQARVRVLVAGEHEQAGRVAVQAVHDAGAFGVVPARDAAREGLHERALGVAVARVDDDTRRLVDHEQVLVLVGDREARGLDRGALDGRLRLDLDLLAAAEEVALGLRDAVDAHEALVDQALGLGARAGVGGEEDVQALARGLWWDLHPFRSRTKTSEITPNVMQMSATLKAGQCGNLMKSVTAPARMRSIRLPAAPPSRSPVGSQTSGRSRWVMKNASSAPSARIATITTTGPPPENRLKATPVLWMLMSLPPRNRSTVSGGLISERTIAFETWSATTTVTATSTVRSAVWRALIRGGSD